MQKDTGPKTLPLVLREDVELSKANVVRPVQDGHNANGNPVVENLEERFLGVALAVEIELKSFIPGPALFDMRPNGPLLGFEREMNISIGIPQAAKLQVWSRTR